MKLHTDPDGTLTVTFSKSEGKTLADAHSIVEQVAFHYRNSEAAGEFYKQLSEDLLTVLATAPETQEEKTSRIRSQEQPNLPE